jgi:hypothetical protein
MCVPICEYIFGHKKHIIIQTAFIAATAEKSHCEEEATLCSARLKAAERLTSGLASELNRWSEEVFRLRNVEVRRTYKDETCLSLSLSDTHARTRTSYICFVLPFVNIKLCSLSLYTYVWSYRHV